MEEFTILVNRYILKELIPQFLSTMIVFCSVIAISQLVRLSNVLVTFGLSAENIFLPFLYIIVPFLPIIIPISYLFGVMISISRLSSDGEITALLASGYSLRKIFMPVFYTGCVLYLVGVACAVNLEAWGRREFVQFIYRKTQTELDNMVRFKIQSGVFLNDFLDYVFYTSEVSSDRVNYKNVLIAPHVKSKKNFIMMAPHGKITGSVEKGDLRMILFNGISYSLQDDGVNTSTLKFKKAELDLLRVFQEKIIGEDTARDDYRSYTFEELREYVKEIEKKNEKTDNSLRVTYLYYSRFANPFIVIAFAFFGLIFGVFEQRHNKNRGYLGSIMTIIVSFVTSVTFRWLGEMGHVNIFFSIWAPQILILMIGVFCVFQKNRLPSSEPIFAIRNLPFFK